MSTKAVNTSLALILLMILSSLSYSLTNYDFTENVLVEQNSSSNTATILQYDPLVPQIDYYENSENPGFMGATYDDRIIIYSEEPDSNGNFERAISVYDFPEYGHSGQDFDIAIPQMTLERELILPQNFSLLRYC